VLLEEITAAMAPMGDGLVAVRSSALHEDARDASAAGLQETVLGVRGVREVAAAVLRCYASIYHERAVTYLARGRRGVLPRVAVAVVVQRMVDADAAGVLFTVDPVGGDRDVMVVEAARGLGCTVVDGAVSPDVWRVDRATGAVRARHLGDKPYAVRVAAGGGTERVVAAHDEARRGPSVRDDTIASLVLLGSAIETHAGSPRDIEWAMERETLWVLQSRPIVGAASITSTGGDLDDRRTWVWSNVNVGEALPGVATPLTWSVAAAFSEIGFVRAFGALGCTVPQGTELVGNFHGRIYLNLTSFMRIARQVPVFNARMLLEFGGGGGLEAIEQQVPPGRWGTFLARLPATGVKYIAENAALGLRVEQFERDFRDARRSFEARDLRALETRALDGVFGELLTLLDRTGAVMLTCASGYLASVVALRTLLRFAVRDEAERFERDLLSGVSDLDSAAPGIALVHIGAIARGEPAARAVIAHGDPATLSVQSLPDGPTRRAFVNFLRAYGFRCTREAELSTPRWREAPGPLFAALRAHVLRGDDSAVERVDRQHGARAAAEEEIMRRIPAVAAVATRHLLQRTWRFSRLRERLRARVTEVLGFVRATAIEVSRRLAARWPASGDDGAFYLSSDEVRAWLSGEFRDPSALITVRRAQVARDVARPDPPAVFVGAPPASVPTSLPVGDRWMGIAASSGVVTGTVRVLRDPTDGAALQPGEVLVTAVADVGWTPLFLIAAAVVTELGGALSHAALVAREYGVPVVASVSGATRTLRTGDRVRVDGDRGSVERLVAEPTDASV
jgi:pyruvate,water dikinase